jgi:hypothetical protein
VGLAGVAASKLIGFWFAIVSIMSIGAGSCLGPSLAGRLLTPCCSLDTCIDKLQWPDVCLHAVHVCACARGCAWPPPGQNVLLAYLKNYPSSLTGAWSSGTGMAGVGGSAFYLVLSVAGVSNQWIFALQASRKGWLGGGKGCRLWPGGIGVLR